MLIGIKRPANGSEFIAYIKANPESSATARRHRHLAASVHELIVQHTGAKLAHVPYRASNQYHSGSCSADRSRGPADQFSTAYPQVQAGKAKASPCRRSIAMGFDNSIPTSGGEHSGAGSDLVGPSLFAGQCAGKISAKSWPTN